MINIVNNDWRKILKINLEFDYEKYADKNNLWDLLGVNKEDCSDANTKVIYESDYAVTEDMEDAFPAQMDDLSRIHYLIRNLRVVTALEIGAGKSTLFIADAILQNKKEFGDFVEINLRKNNAFEVHSIETSESWASEVEKNMPNNLKDIHSMHVVQSRMDTFNSRICTTFDSFPNICPDFIYLDGPDQYAPHGDINGITTRHKDRMPMVSDILRIEHFLLPGTVILVDGRTANARFMKNNLQQDWEYEHYPEYDIHIFRNVESALGVYNQRELYFKFDT